MSAGVLATFATERELVAALPPLRAAGLGTIETYTPKPVETGTSVLPMLMLLAGVLGATASFLLQSYGDTVAYPLDIGGRPNFSWPAFIPIAFENGVARCGAGAVSSAFLLSIVCRDCTSRWMSAHAIRRATRDMWCVAIQTDQPERARAMLRDLSPIHLEELP